VDGGPVDERRRREPRAHRFQAVEGTQVSEQPSSFAGGRSVDNLWSLRVKGDFEVQQTSRRSLRKKRSRRHAGWALQPHIGSRSDDIGCPKGERGGDCSTLCRRHRASLGSSTVSNARERNFGTFTATFARPFDLHAVLATPRRWARSSKPVGGKQLASLAQWAQARGAGETAGGNLP